MPETRRTTVDEIIQADDERVEQAWTLALKEAAPYPGDDATVHEVRRWVDSVNKIARKIGDRLN